MIVDVALVAALLIYLAASMLLFVFGTNLAWYSVVAWRNRRQTSPSPRLSEPLPMVTVQLPIYNELYVARRLIEAVCAFDYPKNLFHVQVLDDSDDETSAIVAAAVAAALEEGVDIEHLRRSDRVGFKAGALAAGLEQAKGSLIALFDADFVPPSDFLLRAVCHFEDPELAFVQARWDHLNGDFSWLTRLQVPAIDAHFQVEQRVRGLRGHWFNFNGTAGIWRAAAIVDAGGWQTDTLTEDLDLSYRAHLRGWRGLFLPDLGVPAELPAQLSDFRRQQHRWARGSLECAAKLLGPIWRCNAGLGTKFQATIHLLAYGVHLLLMVILLSYPAVVLATSRLDLRDSLYRVGLLLSLAALAPTMFLVTGQLVQCRGRPARVVARLPTIAAMVIFGSGLMVNTTRAAIDILFRPNPEFERTAKFGLLGNSEQPTGWGRYVGHLDRVVYAEILVGLYGWAAAVLAVAHGSWGIAFYAAMFGSGILAVATSSIGQALRLHRSRPAAARPITSATVASRSTETSTMAPTP